MRFRRAIGLVTLILVAGAFSPAELSAQEAGPSSTEEIAPGNGENSTGENETTAWERLIYVPYKNLKKVFNRQGASVLIPYAEYLKLWAGIQGGPLQPDGGPPVPAVITKAHYSGRIDENFARIDATFSIRVLGKPWVELPIRFGTAAVGRIRSDDVLLRGTGKGTYSLLLPKRGEHEVTLELVARVGTSPEGRSFEFECPAVGITTLDLTIPEANQSVELTPRLVSLPIEADDGQTRITATLGATPKIGARWHPSAGSRPKMELLAAVTNQLQVSVEEGIVHADAFLTHEVVRGEMRQLQIAVPRGHRILDVSSRDAKLQGWNAVTEENRQVVTVDLLGSVTGKLTVEIHTEGALTDEAIGLAGIDERGEVHGIHAVGAVRESGRLIVAHADEMELAIEKQQGLRRVDAADVPQPLRRANARYYRFYSPSFQLEVTARRVEPRIVVRQGARMVFRDDELQLRSEFVYEVDRAGVFRVGHAPAGKPGGRQRGLRCHEVVQGRRCDAAADNRTSRKTTGKDHRRPLGPSTIRSRRGSKPTPASSTGTVGQRARNRSRSHLRAGGD